jgi:plasmid stabilization system protein ParE
VKVRLSKRAQRAIATIDARWREGADHPQTFLNEMLAAVEFLETVSTPGTPCPTQRRPLLKRLLLEKSKCHVYFEINERKRLLEVLTVWDGRRGRSPKL